MPPWMRASTVDTYTTRLASSRSHFLIEDERNDYRAEIRDDTCTRAERAIILHARDANQ